MELMTLGLTPTPGPRVQLSWCCCHLSASSLPFFLCRLSRPSDQPISWEEWGADGWLLGWTLIVHLQGALGPGNGYLETWWQMLLKIVAVRHRFPGNRLHGPALSLALFMSLLYPAFFFFFLPFLPMTSFHNLRVSFTMIISVCPSLFHSHTSVGVL